MHNLIIDNIKLNDNTDEHFEELHRKHIKLNIISF